MCLSALRCRGVFLFIIYISHYLFPVKEGDVLITFLLNLVLMNSDTGYYRATSSRDGIKTVQSIAETDNCAVFLLMYG